VERALSEGKVPVIELRGISKLFPGVRALSQVDFDIYPGEVHALCGENGAGKSTLIKVMTGAHTPDVGEIYVNGEKVAFSSPQQALGMGIACIYQELSIVPQLDVAKNLFLGNVFTKGNSCFLDEKRLYADAEEILQKYVKLDVSPHEIAGNLSVAQQQMIEIGRALTRQAKVIIMDEPTSSLSDKEAETLFDLIRMLKESGIAIIYISHKLDEVMELSDRITVLRDGQKISTVNTCDTTKEQLISSMLGRELSNMFNKTPADIGEPVLSVKGLTRKGVFEDISFDVRQGEIVGFFGLVGAGRTEIMRAIFGIDRYDSGEVYIAGEKLKGHNVPLAIKKGIGFATEDRKSEGLALRLSVLLNMTIVHLSHLGKGGVINHKKQSEATDGYVQSIRVKTPSTAQLVGNLSGGNQQKVVVAKWLMTQPRVLILDEPTRGVDVGSKSEIYGLVNELAHQGVAVVVVSSEMEEILGMCDKVNVIHEGKLVDVFDAASSTTQQVLSAAFGGVAT
jgi:ABC-type sugar transport system ATPase subunit